MIAVTVLDLKGPMGGRTFDYKIPLYLDGRLTAGCRVMVPFGRGNKRAQGMVIEVKESSPFKGLKEIAQLIDQEPLLDSAQLGVLSFVKERCFCSYFDVLKSMLPAGIRYVPTDILEIVMKPSQSSDIIEAIASMKKPTASALENILMRPLKEEIAELIDQGILRVKSVRGGKIAEGTTRKMARLCRSYDEVTAYLDSLGKKGEKQERVCDVMMMQGEMSAAEVAYLAGVSQSVIDTLEKNGIVETYERELIKNPYEGKLVHGNSTGEIKLTEEQRVAVEGISSLIESKKPAVSLLYGVTGSGKTLCYLSLIDKLLDEGKGAIVLVPEIVLTPQLTDRFIGRYGDNVAVLHSRLAETERRDAWKQIKRGVCKIVVGTRSAVFAPVKNLGLIVMDEEQDSAYKSESTPRYHARIVAKYRAANENATLLLCSATPSVESFAAAKEGRYSLFELKSRFSDNGMPSVTVTNLRDELSAGMSSVTGPTMIKAIGETLAEGKQAILFLNRRGYNTFFSCKICGESIVCGDCSISMTYHSANGLLMCHYCGKTMEVPQVCPSCKVGTLMRRGFGTQRVEEEIARLFPEARILRMDMDTTSYKMSHEEMLTLFATGEYDILLGTQMVTKGLDMPNVSLVGVLFADSLLMQDDYRASERAFSLLTQVVGRAGRADTPGRAIIETFIPDNAVIDLARRQDYLKFFIGEIAFRRTAAYPPYCDIYCMVFSGEDEDKTKSACEFFVNHLEKVFKKDRIHSIIMFPAMRAPVYKINGRHRYRIIMKCVDSKKIREILSVALAELSAKSEYANIYCSVDLNPYSMN